MPDQPHSADYFNDSRDFWWNRDFLSLMSTRWDLPSARNLLDVGCGQGHWTRALAPFLSPACQITGIDREERSLEVARNWPAPPSIVSRVSCPVFRVGSADAVPFGDSTFDLVTCQTLLIHVKDPLAVLREMLRVLTPGGRLIIAEPNNIPSQLSSLELQKPIPETIALLEFQLTCERGKMNLGEGFNSCGPQVPGWLSELGVEEIRSYSTDRTETLLPPYETPRERALLRDAQADYDRGLAGWNQKDAERYYTAGGGEPTRFPSLWSLVRSRDEELLAAAKTQTLRATFTPIFLLVSGKKPTR